MPPMTTMAKIRAQQAMSQSATGRVAGAGAAAARRMSAAVKRLGSSGAARTAHPLGR